MYIHLSKDQSQGQVHRKGQRNEKKKETNRKSRAQKGSKMIPTPRSRNTIKKRKRKKEKRNQSQKQGTERVKDDPIPASEEKKKEKKRPITKAGAQEGSKMIPTPASSTPSSASGGA